MRSPTFKKKFRESEKRYTDLLRHLPVGVYRTTPDGKFIQANRALARILGYDSELQLMNLNVQNFYVRPRDRREHLRKLAAQATVISEFPLRRKDGRLIWARDYPRAVMGPRGRIKHFDGIMVDITREKSSEEKLRKALEDLENSGRDRQKMIRKLEHMSRTDELTGVLNRRGFFNLAKPQIELASQKRVKMFLLFLDLDNLKAVNDTCGHRTGDAALKNLARILRKTFRSSDGIGRVGGDEFAVLPIGTSMSGVRRTLRRLQHNIKVFNKAKRRSYQLSVSYGLAAYDGDHPLSIDKLVAEADRFMYGRKGQKPK